MTGTDSFGEHDGRDVAASDIAESAGDLAATGPGADAAGPAGAPTPAPAGGRVVTPGSPVAQAIAQLDGLDGRPLAEHADAYQQAHESLQGALADIDDA